MRHRFVTLLPAALLLAACDNHKITSPPVLSFHHNPCLGGDTLVLAEAQTARLDCSNGGTTFTLAGNGADYLIVPSFPTDQAAKALVPFSLASGYLSPSLVADRAALRQQAALRAPGSTGTLPRIHPNPVQLSADRAMMARGRRLAAAASRAAGVRRQALSQAGPPAAPPPLGSVASFRVLNNFNTGSFTTVAARLMYVGANILLYQDTLSPPNGFTPTQLTSYGVYFDSTLYGIDTTAFGPPSDIDNNGRVIVLLSPVVNADTPTSAGNGCANGFVAGFFNPEDLTPSGPSDPNSNLAEIFYSIVPDPGGLAGCPHTVADVNFDTPAVFLHELQHLISWSQHVVINKQPGASSWLDEGMSIAAEELGSLYYEAKCPPPSCRTNSSQIFPDSSQGFIQSLLYDSYQYALFPDTAAVLLSDDSQDGFGWRGGSWLLVRWLVDQYGQSVYRKIETGPADGLTDIEQATGQSFPSLWANFGLALYTDSLPGLVRGTAPAINRFVTRNVKQLWARLYATSGPAIDIPTPEPVFLLPVSSDTSAAAILPGTMTFYRLNTGAGSRPVTVRWSTTAGTGLAAALKPQLAIFRLPAGQ